MFGRARQHCFPSSRKYNDAFHMNEAYDIFILHKSGLRCCGEEYCTHQVILMDLRAMNFGIMLPLKFNLQRNRNSFEKQCEFDVQRKNSA